MNTTTTTTISATFNTSVWILYAVNQNTNPRQFNSRKDAREFRNNHRSSRNGDHMWNAPVNYTGTVRRVKS